MTNKTGKDVQLSFEFDNSNQKVKFITVTGKCRCGYSGEFKKGDIVLEMTVPCPECNAVIIIK
ncbi:MAG: hypothetical protein CVV49_21710 [Spirochaetae bacterium HGW-Spirochaetae-5]|nr:MAG: hypothetical protein CVV49_21710 [Spirochaetae bacterium HGW-Spirochaetae-5]